MAASVSTPANPAPWPDEGDGAVFRQRVAVHFSHCDPAGIVFFPQYFVMLNNLVETWFTQALEIDYADLLGNRRVGLPTVSLQSEFLAPSRMGETIELALRVTRVGQKSITLSVACNGESKLRFRLMQVLVTTSLTDHRAMAIPPDLLAALRRWQAPTGVH
jgi:4-hydroxybenzoyl-CoA thioesterase